MKCVASYNPVCDITPVDQFGYVDLGKAFIEGVVPEISGIIEDRFNGIDDPRSIVGSPRNVFDAIEMGRVVHNYVPPASGVNDGENIDKGE